MTTKVATKITLPYKNKPQASTELIGNDQIGTLEFPKFNSLKVGEAQVWENQSKKQVRTTLEIYRVAGIIARAKGIEIVDAVDLIQESNDDLWLEFANELEQITKAQISPIDIQLEKATAIIKSRLVPEFTLEDCQQLPEQLIKEIADFGDRERLQIKVIELPDSPSSEE